MKLSEGLFSHLWETAVYGERFLNDSKGRFEDYSEVDPKYDPQGDALRVDIPFCILPPERCVVLQSFPSKEVLARAVTPEGYRFFWHPDVVRQELGVQGTVSAQPTSSTRTLLTEDSPRVYIKTDLDKKHFRFTRRLQRSSVEHSVAVCNELRQFVDSLDGMTRYAFLPESLGIVVRGGEHEGSGVLFRETVPYYPSTDRRLLLPYHALYASDPFQAEDQPLLIQMLERNETSNYLEYFVSEIVGPILEVWVLLVSRRGILPELHGQNALAELDNKFRIVRVVHRDFQGTYSDSAIRINNGLPLFTKHVAGEEAGTTTESQYSHVFDGMIGRYLLSRLSRVFCSHFNIPYDKVAGAIRDYHRALPGWDVAKFPPTTYRFALSARDQVGNDVRFRDTGQVPEFR